MAIKRTAVLKVAPSEHIAEGVLNIHPDEGFDIGLMTLSHAMRWCTGIRPQEFLDGETGECESVQLTLLNNCKPGLLEMNMKQWKKAGSPAQVVILLEEDKMYVVKVRSEPADEA